jgi:hypothetical protein
MTSTAAAEQVKAPKALGALLTLDVFMHKQGRRHAQDHSLCFSGMNGWCKQGFCSFLVLFSCCFFLSVVVVVVVALWRFFVFCGKQG